MGIDRERLLRTGTFWLRPDFLLRVVGRFQSILGFDRAIGLASGALTATIPLTILISTVLPGDNGARTADRVIARYGLSGDGAAAMRDALSPADGVQTGIGFFGAILLIVAVLSFTRGIQRLFEQTWELAPLSVRNSINGLIWISGLSLYLMISGVLHTIVDDGLENILVSIALTPLVIGFLIWTGEILSARRITRRELLPFGVVGAAVLAIYQVGADIYVPHLFDTYAARYGVIGAVFAMISALFGWMLALVASAALGREVGLELDRIRDGIRPSDDEVSRQWAVVVSGARERRDQLRHRWRSLRDRG